MYTQNLCLDLQQMNMYWFIWFIIYGIPRLYHVKHKNTLTITVDIIYCTRYGSAYEYNVSGMMWSIPIHSHWPLFSWKHHGPSSHLFNHFWDLLFERLFIHGLSRSVIQFFYQTDFQDLFKTFQNSQGSYGLHWQKKLTSYSKAKTDESVKQII